MRTVPSRIVTGTSRSTRMLNVSRGCHCTDPGPPGAGPVLPRRGVCSVLPISPAVERLKDRVRVQPWSVAAWDDPPERNTNERHRRRHPRWRPGWEVETVAGTWDWDLLAGPATITEGPAWDGAGLLYTSIENNEIRRYNPSTGDVVMV